MTWALATIAALLIGYATVSRRLEGLNVSGAIFFTTAGLLVGLVGLVDLEVHGEQVKLLAEITLTLVLFADASRISLRALRHESAVPLRLVGIGPPLTNRGRRRDRGGGSARSHVRHRTQAARRRAWTTSSRRSTSCCSGPAATRATGHWNTSAKVPASARRQRGSPMSAVFA